MFPYILRMFYSDIHCTSSEGNKTCLLINVTCALHLELDWDERFSVQFLQLLFFGGGDFTFFFLFIFFPCSLGCCGSNSITTTLRKKGVKKVYLKCIKKWQQLSLKITIFTHHILTYFILTIYHYLAQTGTDPVVWSGMIRVCKYSVNILQVLWQFQTQTQNKMLIWVHFRDAEMKVQHKSSHRPE